MHICINVKICNVRMGVGVSIYKSYCCLMNVCRVYVPLKHLTLKLEHVFSLPELGTHFNRYKNLAFFLIHFLIMIFLVTLACRFLISLSI